MSIYPAENRSMTMTTVKEGEVDLAALGRGGTVGIWAFSGLLTVIFALEVWIRWITSSTEFVPVPVMGPDAFAPWRLIALRVFEIVTLVLLFVCIWAFIIRPWMQERKLTIGGKMLIAGAFVCVIDGWLNQHHYLFAWNQHGVNMGAWAAFMPFHTGATSPRYGEALLWGLPMYIYMVVGFCAVTISFIKFVQRYYPNLTKSAALAISFLVITVLDFLVEVPAIWITHAYMYSKTFGPLTLFAGELHQFPIYEATGVGLIGMCGTAIWLSAAGDPNEVSFIERGYEKFPPLLQTPVRILAYIGALFIIILLTYHIPFNWWGVIGDCTVELPSYMQVPLAGGFN